MAVMGHLETALGVVGLCWMLPSHHGVGEFEGTLVGILNGDTLELKRASLDLNRF